MSSSTLLNSEQWLTLLFISSLKATCVCAVVYIWLIVVKRSSAAVRHWIGSLALLSTLLIPLLTLVIPSWSLFVGDTVHSPIYNTSFTRQINPLLTYANNTPRLPVPQAASMTQHAAITQNGPLVTAPDVIMGAASIPATPLRWPDIALALWMLGGCATLGRWLVATKRVQQVVRQGWQNDDPAWDALLISLRDMLHIRRPVTLVFSETVGVPLTLGLRHPVIVLPCSALSWSAERRRIVLLHELVHIARWDYLTQWLALIGCALNWFNPNTS